MIKMPFSKSKDNVEQRRSKRTIQEGIEKFMKKLSPCKLLESKNTTQRKIDGFFQKNKMASLPTITRKRKSIDGPEAGSSAKRSILSCGNTYENDKEKVDCIEIDDSSSEDEFYTAPNTQSSDKGFIKEIAQKAFSYYVEEHSVIPSSPVLKKRVKLMKQNEDSTQKSSPCYYGVVEQTAPSNSNTEKSNGYLHKDISHLPSVHSKIFDEKADKRTSLKDNSVKEAETLIASCIETPNEFDRFKLCTDTKDKSMKSNLAHQPFSDKRKFFNPLEQFRFKVESISEELVNHQVIKTIYATNKSLSSNVTIEATDNWAECATEVGDEINLILDDTSSLKCSNNRVRIDLKQNAFIVHPDILISGTTVSNGLGCLRRAVLSERFKNTEMAQSENVSNVMLLGSIVHEIFQRAIKLECVDVEKLNKLAKEVVFHPGYLRDMIAVCCTQQKILHEVTEYLPTIMKWIKEYRPVNIRDAAHINMKYAVTKQGQAKEEMKKYPANIAMTEVLDIEENVWSPRYGLKGKIDVTGQFKVKNRQTGEEIDTIMPVEIKTGRSSNSMEHHVQVAIYSMFCDERRNRTTSSKVNSIPAGLLLYLKSGSTTCESLSKFDRSGILPLRNQIAHHVTKTIKRVSELNEVKVSPFPPTTTNTRLCQMCSQSRNCSLVYKSIDEPQSVIPKPSFHLEAMLDQLSLHLSKDDLAYFEHWMICVFLESVEKTKKDKEVRFWRKTANERQSNGKCITGLKLAGNPIPQENARLLQTFKRPENQVNKAVFEEGDMVYVSGTEPEFIAMATGTVTKINQKFITLNSERDFSTYPTEMLYSIDHHVWMTQISVQSSLSNLSMLLSDEIHHNKLRNLIIHHREPTFRKDLHFISGSPKEEIASMLRGLNRTQRQAIKKVILSHDYTLVVGMPGSGKTTTIVAMIRILLLCNLRVLVTSYTHSAVDNLLMKLMTYNVKFLRLGRPSQVHPNVLPFTEHHLSRDFKSPKELQKLYNEAQVVACTCLSVTSHILFAVPGQNRPMFDVCIVDEASQISQPVCLAPLMFSKRFVLVGDHKQLPPLVTSQEARDMGADESLFRRLTCHKTALCELTLQYRMNNDIMDLSNHVTYEGRLECAHPSVATATLKIDLESIEKDLSDQPLWLREVLEPKTCVLFLDTSETSAAAEESAVENKFEASIISKVTQYLVKGGCVGSNIGIIAPFRKQVQLLGNKITEAELSGIEVNTVDKYQGRDKSVILLSFVKRESSLEEKSVDGEISHYPSVLSKAQGLLADLLYAVCGGFCAIQMTTNPLGIVPKGELLSDWRRLNVALTRAKHKLIMVGCAAALRHYSPCKKLLDYLESNEMIKTLSSL